MKMSPQMQADAALRPILEIEDLRIAFSGRGGESEAVKGVSLSVAPGEVLGLVGESGSGKTVTMLAAAGLLERNGRIAGGRVRIAGQDVTRASRGMLRPIRGAVVSMIFQNPRAALNPIRSVGDQIADAIRAHERVSKAQAHARAVALLTAVNFPRPEAQARAYPHELSGGMCQRAMIAVALACNPRLLIADEPTTGLDPTTQKSVMDLLAGLIADRGMAMVLITHDLAMAAQYCARVAVMEQGALVETGLPRRIFLAPRHPYTQRLVAASPTRGARIEDLVPPGTLPALPAAPAPTLGRPHLLEVIGLQKDFGGGARAVDGVSFTLNAGQSLGLVGESGSGKSTTSRLVCRLLDADAGAIVFDGQDLAATSERDFPRSPRRSDIQLVFQDPTDSLNPRFTAREAIADPLRRLGGLRGRALEAAVRETADLVSFPQALLDRLPHQLSGGQKARVGIGRAVCLRPKLMVLDEPTAALDVSVQAVVLHLLERLRRELGMAYLFVSHDLNVVRMMCAETLVMKSGRIVEAAPTETLFTAPEHPYTRSLLAAVPSLDALQGD